jgi:DNA-binding transcriptional MerR regulator
LTFKSSATLILGSMSITGYQIKDVAERTGFSAPTLRYYEHIGLLPQATRAPSGYRVYDDATIERLAFIGRAKQLGCSLDEIADLNTAWDGGHCGPVQDQLRSLVTDKISLARHQIAELLTLTTELERAASALGGHRPDGPCDDGCGCLNTSPGMAMPASKRATASPESTATLRTSTRKPVILTTKPTRPVLHALFGSPA